MSAASGSNKRKYWRCDFCLVALFDDYDAAVVHERTCAAATGENENVDVDVDVDGDAVVVVPPVVVGVVVVRVPPHPPLAPATAIAEDASMTTTEAAAEAEDDDDGREARKKPRTDDGGEDDAGAAGGPPSAVGSDDDGAAGGISAVAAVAAATVAYVVGPEVGAGSDGAEAVPVPKPPAGADEGRSRGDARAVVDGPPPGVASVARPRGWASGRAAINEPRSPPAPSAVLETRTTKRGSGRPRENPLPDGIIALTSKEESDVQAVAEDPSGLGVVSDGMKVGNSPQSKPNTSEPGNNHMIVSRIDHKYKVSNSVTVAVAFDSVGNGNCHVETRVKVEETTDDIHQRHPANERGESSAPVVQTSEFVAERKPRRVILLVAILVPIALLLAIVVPVRLRYGILAFLFLLPTAKVMMSTTKTNRVEERAAMATVTHMPTLREFLSHPDGFHMSFAPAFFGFFAYFGALAAMEEETNGLVVPKLPAESHRGENGDVPNGSTTCHRLQSVSGASAGAMAAVMLAAGIQPRDAADFASTFTWGMVADPPGCGGYVKGNNFEEAMRKFISDYSAKNRTRSPPAVGEDGDGPDDPAAGAGLRLEEGLVPVAVSAFDLMRLRGTILIQGCMARAARSSAGFPGLFQPVAWREGHRVGDSRDEGKSWLPDSLLIDGGITDGLGLNGLGALSSSHAKTKRVINLVVGDFGFKGPSGIKDVPTGVNAESLVSIAIIGTPMCGPWAMKNGPRAFESARKAVADALDKPMAKGTCANHHIIRVDASQWLEEN